MNTMVLIVTAILFQTAWTSQFDCQSEEHGNAQTKTFAEICDQVQAGLKEPDPDLYIRTKRDLSAFCPGHDFLSCLVTLDFLFPTR